MNTLKIRLITKLKQIKTLNQLAKKINNETEQLLNVILESIKDKKGENLVALNLIQIEEAVAKYFVICDAQTHIQTAAIIRNVVEEVELQINEAPYHVEESQVWSIIDYADVVVHVFRTEDRKFYDLEGAWLDAPKKEYA